MSSSTGRSFAHSQLLHVLALVLTLCMAPGAATRAARPPASNGEGRFIDLNGLRFDPKAGEPSIPAHLRHKKTEEVLYHLVQFTDRIDAQMRSDLTAAGAAIFHYVPDNTFLVRADAAAIERVRRLPSVRWVGPYEPAYKLSPQLGREFDAEVQRWIERATAGSRRPVPHIDTSAVIPVTVVAMEDSRSGEVGRALEAAGAEHLQRPRRGRVFQAEIPRAALERLAREPGVLWIERHVPSYLMNDAARWVIQSGNTYSKATPLHDRGLTGVGQLLTLADSGIDFRHGAFADNDPLHCPEESTPCPPGPGHRNVTAYYSPEYCGPSQNQACGDLQENAGPNHGTYTSSEIVGDAGQLGLYDGTPDQSGGSAGPHDGHAYGAKVHVQDISLDGHEVFPSSDIGNLFQDALDKESLLHSNSWGAAGNQYLFSGLQIDDFLWQHRDQGFLAFFVAGNSGFEGHSGSLTNEANAKNSITVGGSQNGTRENFVYCVSYLSCSSRGPAQDGRIKPDLLAPGQEVWSAHGCQTNQDPTAFCDDYLLANGTSGATPIVAAAAALTRQYFAEGWYPTGSRQTVNGLPSSAALLKATLINSAAEVTGSGVCGDTFDQECSQDSECPGSYCFFGTSGYGFQNDYSFPNAREEFYPNNTQGWGRILLDDALFFEGNARGTLIDDAGDDTGVMKDETRSYQLPISDTSLPVEVALVWTDPPALVNVNPALVNDLDLVVVAPDGVTTYRGNKYAGFNLAQSQANATGADRLNNIETVLIRTGVQSGIYSVRVNGYNIPMGVGPDVRQPYALVMTGGIARSRGQIKLDKAIYQPGTTATVKVVDPDSNLNPNAPDTVIVQMTSTLETTPEAITLTETGPASTVFSGTILTQQSGSATSDGKLQVQASDTITATYFDAQDGFGGSSNRTATATADGNGPVISAVTAADVRLNRATITWTTNEPSSSTVHYGTSTPPGSSKTDDLRVTSHSVTLLGLTENTMYHFDVSSTDSVGNTATANNGGAYFQFTTPAPPPVNFEWSMYQNNDSHQGRSSSKFGPPLTLRWSTGTYSSFYPAGLRGPVIAGGTLYTTTTDGVLRARNPLTGTQIWESSAGSQGAPAIPSAVGGVLYSVMVQGGFGYVTAINASNTLLWSSSSGLPGTSFFGPVPVAGEFLYAATTSGNQVYALHTSDGSTAWIEQPEEATTALTVVGGEVLYGSSGTVVALDAADGKRLWATATNGSVSTTPVYGGGKVFIGTEAGRIYALDASTGAVIWNVPGSSSVQSTSLTFDGTNLYFADAAGYHAVSASNGSSLWNRPAPNGGGPLAYAYGHVYAVGGDGVLRVMRTSDGTVMDQKTLGAGQYPSAPAIWNGWVFVTDSNNATYGFQGVQVDTDGDGDPDDTDCAPTNASVNHAATEGVTATTHASCFDGLDNDCDGVVDLDCAVDVSSGGQVFFSGSVTCGGINDLAAASSNNSYECLREAGAPSSRFLIVVWTYSTDGVPAGTNFDLRVEGFRNLGANDLFNFSSSKRATAGTCGIGEGGTATIVSVSDSSDTDELKVADIGTAQSTYCVRVQDSNQTSDSNQDTLTLDRLFVFPTPVAAEDYPASGDVGTVTSGSYVSTQRSEDTREVIREELSGGSYRMWRTWRFQNVPAGSGHKLHLEGFRTVGAGGKLDDFKFYYSTNPLSWSPSNPLTGFTLISGAVISSTSDPSGGIDSSSFGASGLSGTIYIRVIDAQKAQSGNWQNTLNIDHLAIKTVP